MAETVVVAPATEAVVESAETAAAAQAVSEAAATERTEICETAQTERAQVAADAAVAIAETTAVADEEIDELEESVSFLRQNAEKSDAALTALAAGQLTLAGEVTEIKSTLATVLERLTPRSQETVTTEQVSTSETTPPETPPSEPTRVERRRRLL